MRLMPLIALAALSLCACGPSKADVAAVAEGKAVAEAYMVKSAKDAGVQTLPSGVQYVVIKSGAANGPHPKVADEVKVHYEGKLAEGGKVFDSSYDRGVPEVMPLAALIPAWKEALVRMRPGDEWRLIVPPEQGYGEQGAGADIPPNSVLIFRIELIDILAGPDIGHG